MNTAWGEAIKEAFAVCPNGETYLMTLQISHPAIPGETVWLVRDLQNFVAFDELGQERTYEKAAIDIKLPPSGENGEVSMSLVFMNTDERVTAFLQMAAQYKDKCSVTFRAYLATDPSAPENDPVTTLNLTDIKVAEEGYVTGKCTFADTLNRPFGYMLYKIVNFPGLAHLTPA